MTFVFKGKLELNGVDFFIEAENEREAKHKARRGQWDNWEVSPAAESLNWSIDAEKCERGL